MTMRDAYRVLLVEDNELDARSMVRALESESGCEVHRVVDLASGVAMVSSEAFDCVLLDLSLPDSDGLISVETMVARSPHCPVVVLTGLDDPELAVEAVQRGAQDYLVKSRISPDVLARAVRYAVARHSAETELLAVQARLDTMAAREQIARDLHDTVIQRLFATGLTLQAASKLPDRDQLAERAASAVDQIDDAIRELRQTIFGLNLIDEQDALADTLERLAASFADSLGFAPVVRIGNVPPLSPDLERDVVAVTSEALSNVVRHAAASTVTLTTTVDDGNFVVRIIDNGVGAQSADTPSGESHKHGARGLTGNGLRNMRDRAEAHGGTMHFDSSPTGCELAWSVPVEAL